MIELKVQDYCQDCPNFEAETINLSLNSKKPLYMVCCNKTSLCKKIHKHLEKKMKGENSNGR